MAKRSKFTQHLLDVDTNVLEVLRLHLFAEQILNQLVSRRMTLTEEKMGSLQLSFARKLAFAKNEMLAPASVLDAFDRLNQLRNRCAHRFQYSPTRDEILGLFDGMIEELVYDRVQIDTPSLFKRFAGALLNQLQKGKVKIDLA